MEKGKMIVCCWCGLSLLVEPAWSNHPLCPCCPSPICLYAPIIRDIKFEVADQNVELETPFSEADVTKPTPKTEATCPRCHNGEAYFYEFKIWSGNKSMNATILTCCNHNCLHIWREN